LFFRVLSNRLADHHRRRGLAGWLRWRGEESNDVEDAVDRLPHGAPMPDEALDARETSAALRQALGSLSERQRQVVLLRHWQGCSVAEAARALDISGGSVKTHLSRAISALRADLKAGGGDASRMSGAAESVRACIVESVHDASRPASTDRACKR